MSISFNKENLKDGKAIDALDKLQESSSVSFEKFAGKLKELKERDPSMDIETLTKEKLIKYRKDLTVGGRRRSIIKQIIGLDSKVFEAVKATYLFVYEE